ncbi:DUF2812 domain-containing protein [Gracilibacillus sp. S3-1-1]|uniref:DUF2812 domain-containing protein n=1 Tax=Gracilibacillus pellucidus TaxID=3095368 RepID=A0ACC6M8T5_9BACI|nr:DUF2812 domain-containing protein [Gracilibacillus sp. S3-1-1]MDX8047303.1 DUF2812 domain-containing protein [Gracilibacillus sp. S3-1-1]
MSNTKYMMSGGLAFSENKDMEKLRKFSLKGWHVSTFAFMGYKLTKGTSTDYIYSVDYQLLDTEEKEEYVDFFHASGWTHVTSEANMHLFRALPGTKPIHTERETVAEKHENSGKMLIHAAILLCFMTALFWLGSLITSEGLQITFIVIAIILTAITIPTVGTILTTYHNKWKAEGKIILARIAKSVAILFVITPLFVILLTANSPNSLLRLFISMAIGGIALPVLIWIIMSLYYKFSYKGEKI